jgi:hypothetical protein
MPSSIYIELKPEAIALVRSLMPVLGTSDIHNTVAQALGFAKVASPFVNPEGILTLVDPQSADKEIEHRLVDIDVRYGPAGGTGSVAA